MRTRAGSIPIRCFAVLLLAVLGAARQVGAGVTDSIKAMHPKHAENGVECSVCHEAAATSTNGRDALLPQEETCAQCHEVKDPAQCSL